MNSISIPFDQEKHFLNISFTKPSNLHTYAYTFHLKFCKNSSRMTHMIITFSTAYLFNTFTQLSPLRPPHLSLYALSLHLILFPRTGSFLFVPSFQTISKVHYELFISLRS
ncbi:unnamed protein product [Prunus armeniaca]